MVQVVANEGIQVVTRSEESVACTASTCLPVMSKHLQDLVPVRLASCRQSFNAIPVPLASPWLLPELLAKSRPGSLR